MKDVDYMVVAEEVMDRIKKGAFLTVAAGEKVNTMTIGWATIGFVWRKPIFMVTVRKTRYTFMLMEKAADFTVTVPGPQAKEAVAFCGTKSGREVDKFAACNLKTLAGKKVTSPVVDTPGTVFECAIRYKSAMDPAFLDASFESLYPEKDYHTLYFGEILAAYTLP